MDVNTSCRSGINVPTKHTNWTTLVMVALAVLGFLTGLTVPTLRWAFAVETRLHDIELRDRYVHGTFAVPEEK